MPDTDPPENLAEQLRSEGWRTEAHPPEPPAEKPSPAPQQRPASRPARGRWAHRSPKGAVPVPAQPEPEPPPTPPPPKTWTRHEWAIRNLRLKLLALAYSHAATGELVPGEEVTIRVEKEDLAVSLTILLKDPPKK